MNLGFIGTGEITKSVILGVLKSKIKFNKIFISKRNNKISDFLKKKNKLFNEIPDKSDFYFTHKFYLKNYDDKVVISKTNYHLDFVSSVSNKICVS